ncbi:1-acyl-sn-glycerol-3-phosphate acyltransferase [Chitinophaga costaii]|uniref:1-acyl-sn-glycerol-3-phosphate acyltransferase n=1 Tax=Chitinophaga costaii TaxID=1335309 RepID=A0A1C4E488_9BACT|nr:1-acyl-sn-glycerol-3-phosphate acyltransferase [Chitinophaga costaii]SCC38315.1 1-acyl-sn-glycerol-3-phosphate acyltransferase [Chitinophaga costaii]
MNRLKKFLGGLYATYILLLFSATVIILFIPLYATWLFKEPYRNRIFVTIGRGWMAVFMPLIGCPMRRKGLENFKAGQTYVLTCNHNSFMDILVATSSIPGSNKTLAKKSMGNIPVFGPIYRLGAILVNRKDEDSRKQSYIRMKEALHQGIHILLYPEGTRNRTDKPIKPFYDGAFSLAIDTQLPLLPSVLFHTRNILPAGGFYAWPHAVEYHFLPPIDTKGMTRDDIPALKERVFNIMLAHYVAHEKTPPTSR